MVILLALFVSYLTLYPNQHKLFVVYLQKELKDIETPFLHLALLYRGMYQEKVEGLDEQT